MSMVEVDIPDLISDKGWFYKELPIMTVDKFDYFRDIVQEENMIILEQTVYDPVSSMVLYGMDFMGEWTIKVKIILSPQSIDNMKKEIDARKY